MHSCAKKLAFLETDNMSFSAPWYLENYFIVVLQREIAHHVMDAIGKQSIFLLIKYTETTPIFNSKATCTYPHIYRHCNGALRAIFGELSETVYTDGR